MFRFGKEQKVFDITGVKVGGQPGEYPPILIGSIFYHGEKIVTDDKTGKIDKERAEKLIKLQEEYSDKTGIHCMLDVVGSTEEAIQKYISFVAKVTDEPLLIDSPSTKVKVAGVKYAKEIGLERRVIYNSIMPKSKPEEFEALKKNDIKNCILLAYKSAVMTSKDRIKAVKKLLPKAEKSWGHKASPRHFCNRRSQPIDGL